jgi:hypothetical protein
MQGQSYTLFLKVQNKYSNNSTFASFGAKGVKDDSSAIGFSVKAKVFRGKSLSSVTPATPELLKVERMRNLNS